MAGWCAVPVGAAGTDSLVSEASPEDGGPGGTASTYVSPFSLGGADDDDGVDFNPEDYSEVSATTRCRAPCNKVRSSRARCHELR